MNTKGIQTIKCCVAGIFVCLLLPSCATLPTHLGPSIASKDVLYLERGPELVGTLEASDQNNLTFHTVDSGTKNFSLADIQRVELAPPVGDAIFLKDLADPEIVKWVHSAPSSDDFPGRSMVMLYSGTWITIRDDGNIEKRDREVYKILNEKGRGWGTRTVSCFPDITDFKILKARSIGLDGRVSELSHTAIKEAWPNSRFSAYNRRKLIVFAIPNAEVGSVIELETIAVRNKDDIDIPWIFHAQWASNDPTLYREVVLDHPEGSGYFVAAKNMDMGGDWVKTLQAHKKIYNQYPSGEVKTATVIQEGRQRTTWTAGPLPVFEGEPYCPNYADLIPRMCILKKMTWPHIGAYFQKDFESRTTLDVESREYVHRLCDGMRPEDAAHALYNDLVSRIRSIALGPGDFFWTPHPASEIFHNGYANDWDKTFLYYSMLREIGLNPALLVVRPWNWDVWDEEPPSIAQFGDLVIMMNFEGRTVYTACRADTIPFGQLPAHLWDGRTLLISNSTGTLGKLPALSPDDNELSNKIMRIEIDACGNAQVKERRSWSGVKAYGTRWARSKSDNQMGQFFAEQVRRIFPNAELISFSLSDRKNLDEPSWEELVYNVAPLDVISAGKYMELQLPGTSYSPSQAQEGPRRFDIRWGEPWKERLRFEIQLADGIEAVGLPDTVSLKAPWGTFSRTVVAQGENSIIVEDLTEINAYKLHKSHHDDFMDFFFKRQLAGRQRVVLVLKPCPITKTITGDLAAFQKLDVAAEAKDCSSTVNILFARALNLDREVRHLQQKYENWLILHGFDPNDKSNWKIDPVKSSRDHGMPTYTRWLYQSIEKALEAQLVIKAIKRIEAKENLSASEQDYVNRIKPLVGCVE